MSTRELAFTILGPSGSFTRLECSGSQSTSPVLEVPLGAPKSTQHPCGRLPYLDGLRGIAALLVLVFHFLSAYFYWLIPDQTATPMKIADTPFAFLYNGTFCVVVFFVLSGFVVSNSAAKKSDTLWANLGLRYVRLALPAIASILFAWALLCWKPNESTMLYAVIPHDWLRYSYQGSIPPLYMAINDGLIRIFVSGQSLWNNVLWTMKPELIGSCALYLLFSTTKGRVRLITLILVAITLPVFDKTTYEGFMLGGILSELRSSGRLPGRFPLTALFTGILLGFEGRDFSVRMHLPHFPGLFTLGARGSIWYAVGAILIVYSCLNSSALQAVLSTRCVQFLGRISFALYLCHVPLLYTVFAAIYLRALPLAYWKLVCLFVSFVSASLAVGYIGTIGVDEPVLRLTRRLRARSRTGQRPILISKVAFWRA